MPSRTEKDRLIDALMESQRHQDAIIASLHSQVKVLVTSFQIVGDAVAKANSQMQTVNGVLSILSEKDDED